MKFEVLSGIFVFNQGGCFLRDCIDDLVVLAFDSCVIFDPFRNQAFYSDLIVQEDLGSSFLAFYHFAVVVFFVLDSFDLLGLFDDGFVAFSIVSLSLFNSVLKVIDFKI